MSLRTSPLAASHDERGASLTEFGGWEMPVEFDGIREEHRAVRSSVGIFDVSHMGQIEVTGPDAGGLTDRLVTADVGGLAPGRARYAAITDEEGVMLDDTVVYRLPDEGGQPRYLLVPNAGHDAGAEERWRTHRDRWDLEATVENRTEEYAMVAVQGPESADAVAAAATDEVRALERFEFLDAAVDGVECRIARTGYTGEDGFELFAPWEAAETVWSAFDCRPCGLGARDTLRMEAGLLLSGQDFSPEENPRSPYEAGIGFAVALDTRFVGRDALARQREEGVEETLVGLQLDERGVPRHGYAVESADGERIGEVTSGTVSPTLGEPIGLGYVPVEYADAGASVRVVIRGDPKAATVVTLPFVDRP